MNDISIDEKKTLNIEFRVVSPHAVNIYDHLKENKSSY